MSVFQAFYTELEAYSAFDGFLTEATDPSEPPQTDGSETDPVTLPENTAVSKYLRSEGIEKLVMVGLATDYWSVHDQSAIQLMRREAEVGFSLLQTTLSASSAGFDTLVVEPAIRGIDPAASQSALTKIEGVGCKVVGRNGEDWESALKQWIGTRSRA